MKIGITKCIKTTIVMGKKTKTNMIKKQIIKITILKMNKILSRMKNLMARKIWREITKTLDMDKINKTIKMINLIFRLMMTMTKSRIVSNNKYFKMGLSKMIQMKNLKLNKILKLKKNFQNTKIMSINLGKN